MCNLVRRFDHGLAELVDAQDTDSAVLYVEAPEAARLEPETRTDESANHGLISRAKSVLVRRFVRHSHHPLISAYIRGYIDQNSKTRRRKL